MEATGGTQHRQEGHLMQRLSPVKLVVLTAVAATAGGCGGGPGSRGGTAPEASAATRPTLRYFPLAVGNSWTNRVTTYTSVPASLGLPIPASDSGASESPSAISTATFTVTGTQTIGSAKWFVGGYTPPIPSQEPWFGRHNASGLLIKVTSAGTPYYLLKAPLRVGTTWDLPVLNARRKITQVNQTTTVPAGTFHGCLKVKQTYTTPALADLVVTYWFAPGTGVVRTEVRDNSLLTTKIMLVAATVKPI